MFVKNRANRRHASIHHVRGRHDVRAGARMGKRLLRQDFHGRVVGHFSVFNHAAVAVIGVLAQTHVRDHQQSQLRGTNRRDRALHHAMLVQRTASLWILGLRQTKKNHPGNSQGFNLAAFFNDAIDRLLKHTRHRIHFLPHFFARANKQRINQARSGQSRLAHQPANRLRTPQPPRTRDRKRHTDVTCAAKPPSK